MIFAPWSTATSAHIASAVRLNAASPRCASASYCTRPIAAGSSGSPELLLDSLPEPVLSSPELVLSSASVLLLVSPRLPASPPLLDVLELVESGASAASLPAHPNIITHAEN